MHAYKYANACECTSGFQHKMTERASTKMSANTGGAISMATGNHFCKMPHNSANHDFGFKGCSPFADHILQPGRQLLRPGHHDIIRRCRSNNVGGPHRRCCPSTPCHNAVVNGVLSAAPADSRTRHPHMGWAVRRRRAIVPVGSLHCDEIRPADAHKFHASSAALRRPILMAAWASMSGLAPWRIKPSTGRITKLVTHWGNPRG